METEFSIIIPSYNHERYIGGAIESVINQSFKDWELIVIDDGSSDNSVEIIKKYDDSRIKILTQENHDAPYTINRGIKEAHGKYIAILNSDDLFEPAKLEECHKALSKGYDFVFGKAKVIDEENQPMSENDNRVVWINERLNNSEKKHTLDNLLGNVNYYLTTSNYVFSKKVVEKSGYFHEKLHISHDFDFILRVFGEGLRVGFIPKYLINYRLHSDNTISKGAKESYLEASYAITNLLRKKPHISNSFSLHYFPAPIFKDVLLFYSDLSNDEIEKVVCDKNDVNRKKLLGLISRLFFENSEKKDANSFVNAFAEASLVVESKECCDYEESWINAWNLLHRDDKIKTIEILNDKKLLGEWIKVIYGCNKFEETEIFSSIRFENKKRDASNKKIAFYINKLNNGGREKVVQLLANNLIEIGWDVAVFTTDNINSCDYKLDGRIKRIVLPSNRALFLPFLLKQLNELSIYLFASHNWLDQKEILMFAFLRASGISVCFSDHIGFREKTFVENSLDAVNNVLNYGHIINGITCLSRLEMMFWQKFTPNIVYMPNPIEAPIINNRKKSNNKNTIIWIGRLEKHQKQTEQAIKAFAVVLSKKKDAKLIIVGSESGLEMGNYFKELKKLCEQLNCQNQVKFVGFSSNVSEYLNQASVHWITSAYEGFPMVWVEAKSCGVPTILYDMPWVELNGEGSIVVNQGDYTAMANETLLLFDNNELLNDLSRDALNSLIKRFEPTSVLSRWEKFYMDMLIDGRSELFNEEFKELKSVENEYFKKYLKHIIDLKEAELEVAKNTKPSAMNVNKRLRLIIQQKDQELNLIRNSLTWRTIGYIHKALKIFKI